LVDCLKVSTYNSCSQWPQQLLISAAPVGSAALCPLLFIHVRCASTLTALAAFVSSDASIERLLCPALTCYPTNAELSQNEATPSVFNKQLLRAFR